MSGWAVQSNHDIVVGIFDLHPVDVVVTSDSHRRYLGCDLPKLVSYETCILHNVETR